MKLLGSGKLDDFQKVVLSDKVMKALNVRSGDSVVFYKAGGGDRRVEMFKAEGAEVTEEFDSLPQLHLRGLRSNFYIWLILALASLIGGAFIVADRGATASAYALMAVSVVFIIGAILTASQMNVHENHEMLITVGGPYTKDRLLGLSKLVSDGRIITGSLYVNSFFGSNPSEIRVIVRFDGHDEIVGLTKCVKEVSGYSIHRIRIPFPDNGINNGTMEMHLVFPYSGKRILVDARYRLTVMSPESMVIKVEEDGLEADLEFDSMFQKKAFDETLFDPADDDVVL